VTYFVGSKFGSWGGGGGGEGGGSSDRQNNELLALFLTSILRFDKTPSSMTLTNIETIYKFLPLDHPEHYRQN
jgi:hypothetical protein